MRIEKTTDMADVLKTVPIELEIRKKEDSKTKLRDVLSFIQTVINNPLFGFWIAYEGEDVVGYFCAFILPYPPIKSIYLMRIYYDHKHKEVIGGFEQIIRDLAKQFKIKKCRIEVDRRMKSITKKWGFKPIATVMERGE